MAPPALNLKDASFRSLNAFSTATTPLRNSFALSCRSPITTSTNSKTPSASDSRYGAYLEPSSPFPRAGSARPRSPLAAAEKGRYTSAVDDVSTTDESPTDQTWFLPHSPGLPRAPGGGDDGKLGVLSAINIIVGKTMGVGAYSVPSAVFSGVGSVGMTLMLWVVGSLISFCGLAVYLDLGTAMPRSGGERVYLERIFRRPRMLATCMFMSYAVLLGFSTPNAIVLGEHALYAAGVAENAWNVRLVAVLAVTLLCWLHARHPRAGLRLVDALGVAKMAILAVVVVAGVAGGLMGVGADREADLAGGRAPRSAGLDLAMAGDAPSSTAQRNFRAVWAGTSAQPYDHATALLKVLYCYRGYSTANQVLGEVRDPVRTLRIAAPIALALVSAAYLAVNVAFFLVVDKDEFRDAGVVVAAVFFRKVFGDGLGAHMLPMAVVISAAGNIAATSFAQARVNEEMAREGVLPRFWRSDKGGDIDELKNSGNNASMDSDAFGRTTSDRRSGTPTRGLLLHWLVSAAAIIIPPPGKVFNFLVDIGGYPVSVIGAAVSLGLLYLHANPSERWTTPCKAPRLAVVIFAASNCLLLVLPWIPPRSGMGEDGRLPSFAYPVTSLAVLGLGAVYWLFWRSRSDHAISSRSDEDDILMKDDDLCSEGDTLIEGDEVWELRGKSILLQHPIRDIGEDVLQTCGCRACPPQLRRRAVCGCTKCPVKAQIR